jgi:hypothetical protein
LTGMQAPELWLFGECDIGARRIGRGASEDTRSDVESCSTDRRRHGRGGTMAMLGMVVLLLILGLCVVPLVLAAIAVVVILAVRAGRPPASADDTSGGENG